MRLRVRSLPVCLLLIASLALVGSAPSTAADAPVVDTTSRGASAGGNDAS